MPPSRGDAAAGCQIDAIVCIEAARLAVAPPGASARTVSPVPADIRPPGGRCLPDELSASLLGRWSRPGERVDPASAALPSRPRMDVRRAHEGRDSDFLRAGPGAPVHGAEIHRWERPCEPF
jgi:hypothetical protein